MVASSFGTENRTFRQLMGNGLTYRVPRFQRDYSWEEREWEELWEDLLETLRPGGEPAHYMGYLVLQSRDSRFFEVVDGQQRLTTLSLVVLAAMRRLGVLVAEGRDAEDNGRRLEQLRASYIGYLDPVTLEARNKLVLNRHDDGYYRRYLVPLVDRLPQRRVPPSSRRLRRAFEWFERRLAQQVRGASDEGRALAEFVEAMSDKLFFTVITVADELNAYRVFETLNARGVRLSTTDLLKNRLFAVLAAGVGEAEERLERAEERWEAMVDRLGSESLPDFFRMHWNSRHRFARRAELFKVVRGRLDSAEAVFRLLREMDEDVEAYLALLQPEGSQWPDSWRRHAAALRLFAVRQPFPMLMAGRRRLSDGDFEGLLRAAVVISLRYNVIGGRAPGEQERVYNEAALRIERGEACRLGDVLRLLRPVYRGDDEFRADFATRTIRTTHRRGARVARYLLAELERQAGGARIDPDGYTLEHVLPRSPGDGWEAFEPRDLEDFVDRLGNLVLLEKGLNQDLGNAPYAQKREVYLRSGLRLTRRLAEEHETWTPEQLERRQRWMARLATSAWRLSQLD